MVNPQKVSLPLNAGWDFWCHDLLQSAPFEVANEVHLDDVVLHFVQAGIPEDLARKNILKVYQGFVPYFAWFDVEMDEVGVLTIIWLKKKSMIIKSNKVVDHHIFDKLTD